ncbi:hypothetical protein B0T13DRAFT_449158 [Neurospora crassa]|nr:hypothetical protein B0T13DRAFT_449158 [Neurospora crassa]
MVEVGEHCHHGNLNHPSTVMKSWMRAGHACVRLAAVIGPLQRDNAFAPYPAERTLTSHKFTFGLVQTWAPYQTSTGPSLGHCQFHESRLPVLLGYSVKAKAAFGHPGPECTYLLVSVGECCFPARLSGSSTSLRKDPEDPVNQFNCYGTSSGFLSKTTAMRAPSPVLIRLVQRAAMNSLPNLARSLDLSSISPVWLSPSPTHESDARRSPPLPHSTVQSSFLPAVNVPPRPSSELLSSPARVRTRQQKVMQERRVLLLSLDVSCAVLPRSGAVRRGPSGHGHGTAVSVVPAVP